MIYVKYNSKYNSKKKIWPTVITEFLGGRKEGERERERMGESDTKKGRG